VNEGRVRSDGGSEEGEAGETSECRATRHMKRKTRQVEHYRKLGPEKERQR